jgi:hypothetical protein
MSEAQYRWLRSLIQEREYNVVLPLSEQLSMLDECFKFMKISTKTASTMIDRAKASPRRSESTANTPRQEQLADGIYVIGGVFYKVIHAIHGSGRQYAKKFNDFAQDWEMARGALSFIHPDHKLTEEQAKEFGHIYGRCVVCGRTLTDEESISLGIGPVCRSKTFG